MTADNLTISAFARKTHTGRNSIKRILNPRDAAITLKTIIRALNALEMKLTVSLAPLPPSELNQIAKAMVAAKTPAEADRLRQVYLAGFYGAPISLNDAKGSTIRRSKSAARTPRDALHSSTDTLPPSPRPRS